VDVLERTKSIEALAGVPPGLGPANRLLASLPDVEQALLSADCVTLDVQPGQVLIEAGELPDQVLFPATGTVLTLLAVTPDRKPVETAMVGPEGATGALFGPMGAPAGFRVQVLTEGMVLRIPAERFGAALATSAALRAAIGRYVMAQLGHVQIGVACAALHPVEARAARWMLDLYARTGDRSLPLTQEALSDLLGVRRTTITRVVATLEQRGLVRHRRGRIIVMDRDGLAGAACGCHAQASRHFAAVAPGLYPDGTAVDGGGADGCGRADRSSERNENGSSAGG
jgi:CRP-like cAMP-binding protein